MTLTYQQAGVDIEAGNRLVDCIKTIVPKTHTPGVLGGIGGFGALFELPLHRYKNPVLVSTTDGVGTKLKLAVQLERYDTIGIDLVAMCVNDLIVCGAEPLFFLDYYATGHLEVTMAEKIIQGIADGCCLAGCALVGGETAEMPGVYHDNDFDLAGFSVGIVEKDQLITKQLVSPGDALIALASSGIHSNGYSLVRHMLTERGIDIHMPFGQHTLIDELITPTRIYVKSVLQVMQHIPVHAAAHITGGGLIENLPRVMPAYTQAVLNRWQLPEIFAWLQQQTELTDAKFYQTFNGGIGFVLCVSKQDVAATLDLLTAAGETAWMVGEIAVSQEATPQVILPA